MRWRGGILETKWASLDVLRTCSSGCGGNRVRRIGWCGETPVKAFWFIGVEFVNHNTFSKIDRLLLNTYDHRSVRTGHPVRSAIHKH
jgi:hypothetical protein